MNRQDEPVLRAVLEINNVVLALVAGIITGSFVFIATIWLVLKGGQAIGPHLSLLSQFFPGYSVTFFGSFVGFAYGFISGYMGGWSVAWLYNRFTQLRVR